MDEGPESESYKQQIPDLLKIVSMHSDVLFIGSSELAAVFF